MKNNLQMTDQQPLPPFVRRGEDDACFYVLIYHAGTYGDGPTREGPVYLTLCFSTATGYTRFSDHVVDGGGKCFLYHRGFDDLDSAEFALLRCWNRYQVKPARWHLFPLSQIPRDAWPEAGGDRAAYFEARRQVCRLLYPFQVRAHFAVAPLFHPDPDPAPPSVMDREGTPESREIRQAWHHPDDGTKSP